MSLGVLEEDLFTEFKLDKELVSAYRADGHALVRGLCSQAEVDHWRPIFADTVRRYKGSLPDLDQRDTYGKAFIQVINLWQMTEAVRPFVLARRFAKVAAELMGVSGVRLYHDQALYKEPGGGHTPWHQDQYYWPLDGYKTVTLWMPLVDVPLEMGALTFASGSHKEGFLGHLAISDASEEIFKEHVRKKGYPIVNNAMKAGDATFHSGWCLHNAPGNSTDKMREVMTIIYVEDGAIISQPDNVNRKNDMERFFPGLGPGDAAASPLNPLLYSAEQIVSQGELDCQ